MLNAIFLQKLIGDSSTMRSRIVVHKDKLVSDGCCIRHDVRLQHLVNISSGGQSTWRKMALSVWNGLQDPPTATPSRTSGITSGGKPTRGEGRYLFRGLFQRILQRAWANLDQRRIQTLINSMLKRCREVIEVAWTYQLLNTSFIVMLIKSKT